MVDATPLRARVVCAVVARRTGETGSAARRPRVRATDVPRPRTIVMDGAGVVAVAAGRAVGATRGAAGTAGGAPSVDVDAAAAGAGACAGGAGTAPEPPPGAGAGAGTGAGLGAGGADADAGASRGGRSESGSM
jgi:hypothetical protein